VAKMLAGISTGELWPLFQECNAPGVRSFGAILTHKLRETFHSSGPLGRAHRPSRDPR
jgi:hypothetical protein